MASFRVAESALPSAVERSPVQSRVRERDAAAQGIGRGLAAPGEIGFAIARSCPANRGGCGGYRSRTALIDTWHAPDPASRRDRHEKTVTRERVAAKAAVQR